MFLLGNVFCEIIKTANVQSVAECFAAQLESEHGQKRKSSQMLQHIEQKSTTVEQIYVYMMRVDLLLRLDPIYGPSMALQPLLSALSLAKRFSMKLALSTGLTRFAHLLLYFGYTYQAQCIIKKNFQMILSNGDKNEQSYIQYLLAQCILIQPKEPKGKQMNPLTILGQEPEIDFIAEKQSIPSDIVWKKAEGLLLEAQHSSDPWLKQQVMMLLCCMYDKLGYFIQRDKTAQLLTSHLNLV